MKIIWHGHSSFTISFSDIKIIIDPFLSGNPNFGNQNMDEITSELTHIALTHGHNDHVGDTVDLAKKTSAEVIANADLCSYLATKGLNKFNQGNTGGTIVYDKFSVTFVQAHHSSSTVDENGISHSLGFSNGLVFHIKNEKTVYHMGDTDIFGDMQLIEELHKSFGEKCEGLKLYNRIIEKTAVVHKKAIDRHITELTSFLDVFPAEFSSISSPMLNESSSCSPYGNFKLLFDRGFNALGPSCLPRTNLGLALSMSSGGMILRSMGEPLVIFFPKGIAGSYQAWRARRASRARACTMAAGWPRRSTPSARPSTASGRT